MKADSIKNFRTAFRFLIVVVKATMVLTWLPLIRGAFDGDDYTWGFEYFGYQLQGAGTGGDFPVLVLLNLVGLATIYLAYKSSKRIVFYTLAFVWLLPFIYLFIDALIHQDLILYGDTLGFAIDLAYLALPFVLLTMTSLAITFNSEVIQALEPASFDWNKRYLFILLGSIPFQFILLKIDTYGITDPIGVLLTIIQCLLLSKVFKRA